MIKIPLQILKSAIKNRVKGLWGGVCLPYKVTLISTYLCNSRCRTCNIWKIYQEQPEKKKEELSNEELYQAVSSLKENLVWLNITGGEPLLRNDLAGLVSKIYSTSKNLRFINMPINGLEPGLAKETLSKICSLCTEAAVYVSLSLDGLHADYKEIRGIDGFPLVLETYHQLTSLPFKNLVILFGITLSKFNLGSVFKTVEFLKSIKASYIITFSLELELFQNQGTGVDLRMTGQEAFSCLRSLEKEFKVDSLTDFLPKGYLRLGELFLREGKTPLACPAGYATITLDPYGNIIPCPFLKVSYGNVKEQGFDLPKIIKEGYPIRKQLGDCRLCWQSCQAYPAMFSSPLKTMYLYLKAR